jgi:Uma2 family endonuclease
MTNTVIASTAVEEQDVPRFVSEEEYLRVWAEQHYEWVDGELIKVPGNFTHNELILHLLILLRTYFVFRPIGKLLSPPFMLQFDPSNKRRYREPDIMVLLNESSVGTFTDTAVIGAADICIEVVSPESVMRDYSTKLLEYQDAGVREYWLIDRENETAIFHVRNERNYFTIAPLNTAVYVTPLLPGLKIDTTLFWQESVTNSVAIVDAVRAMLTDTPA